MINEKPNIFLITIDSLRSDHCFGENRSVQTPNIDYLINIGAYFSQAISSADQTGTSLASIYTGLSPSTTGLTHFNFSKQVKTYFNYFGDCGFFY
jgi:iduronate 2-sulfatase